MTLERQDVRRALILHNYQLVVDLIELTLNHGVFVVRAAANLADAEAILAGWRPDLAVVDLDHDDSSPLLRRLGASNSVRRRSGTPVLGLARRGDLRTRLEAFDMGVDDILAVPFSPEELLARAIVISRRSSRIDQPLMPSIKLGEIEIDIFNREVRTGTSIIHLTGIEQNLLYVLASRAGRVVTREEILDAVWGTDFVADSNVVDRHIRSLRTKLQNDYRHPRFIATVPGRGYRFIPTFTNLGWNSLSDTGMSSGHHPSHYSWFGDGRFEVPAKLNQGLPHAALDRTQRSARPFRDLALGQTAEVGEVDRLALNRRQQGKHDLDLRQIQSTGNLGPAVADRQRRRRDPIGFRK